MSKGLIKDGEKAPSRASFTILGSTTLVGESVPTTIFTTAFAFIAPFMVPTLVLLLNSAVSLVQPIMSLVGMVRGGS